VLFYENRSVDTKKVGILEVDESNFVTGFLEKPDPSTTESRLCCPCFYMLDKDDVAKIDTFILETGKNDATGYFIQYMIQKHNVLGRRVEGRYDVGNLKDYIVTNKDFL
jgi:glucose-1-phosphate thymidylyltransferase